MNSALEKEAIGTSCGTDDVAEVVVEEASLLNWMQPAMRRIVNRRKRMEEREITSQESEGGCAAEEFEAAGADWLLSSDLGREWTSEKMNSADVNRRRQDCSFGCCKRSKSYSLKKANGLGMHEAKDDLRDACVNGSSDVAKDLELLSISLASLKPRPIEVKRRSCLPSEYEPGFDSAVEAACPSDSDLAPGRNTDPWLRARIDSEICDLRLKNNANSGSTSYEVTELCPSEDISANKCVDASPVSGFESSDCRSCGDLGLRECATRAVRRDMFLRENTVSGISLIKRERQDVNNAAVCNFSFEN